MKTFVLALVLLSPDGAKSQMPIEMWRFTSMAECVMSSTFMNKGKIAAAQNYSCIEYDPSMNVAKAAPQPQPAKRNS